MMIDTTGGSNKPVVTQSVPILSSKQESVGRSYQIDSRPPPRANPTEFTEITSESTQEISAPAMPVPEPAPKPEPVFVKSGPREPPSTVF